MKICHMKKMLIPQGLLLWCSAFFFPKMKSYATCRDILLRRNAALLLASGHILHNSIPCCGKVFQCVFNEWLNTRGLFYFIFLFFYVTHWTQRGWFRGLQKSSQQCPEVFGGQVMRCITLSAQSLHCESQFQPSVPQNDTMRLYPSVRFVRPSGDTRGRAATET